MNALRRSPKNGDFTATERNVLRMAFTTSVDSASPSTSSAMTSSGLPVWMTFSSIGSRSATALILPLCSSTRASSRTASPASGSVMKYGET
jgi:hypothetical protein